MTQKGQITVPAEVRAQLGLAPGDRVEFGLEGGTITIRPARSHIREFLGMVEPRNRPEDWTAVRAEVEALMAEDVVAEG